MPERLLPHHDGSPLHVSTQAPALGETVRVRVRVPARLRPARVGAAPGRTPNREPRFSEAVLLRPLDGPATGSADGWDWWEAPVEVENPVHGYRWLLVGEDGRQHWLNQLGLFTTETRDQDDFRLVAHAAPPEWAAESVLYQVFPDRFARSDAAAAPPRRRSGRSPPTGTTRSTTCRRGARSSSTAATSTACASTSTTSSASA